MTTPTSIWPNNCEEGLSMFHERDAVEIENNADSCFFSNDADGMEILKLDGQKPNSNKTEPRTKDIDAEKGLTKDSLLDLYNAMMTKQEHPPVNYDVPKYADVEIKEEKEEGNPADHLDSENDNIWKMSGLSNSKLVEIKSIPNFLTLEFPAFEIAEEYVTINDFASELIERPALGLVLPDGVEPESRYQEVRRMGTSTRGYWNKLKEESQALLQDEEAPAQ